MVERMWQRSSRKAARVGGDTTEQAVLNGEGVRGAGVAKFVPYFFTLLHPHHLYVYIVEN